VNLWLDDAIVNWLEEVMTGWINNGLVVCLDEAINGWVD
jgi:hypothetical protein